MPLLAESGFVQVLNLCANAASVVVLCVVVYALRKLFALLSALHVEVRDAESRQSEFIDDPR